MACGAPGSKQIQPKAEALGHEANAVWELVSTGDTHPRQPVCIVPPLKGLTCLKRSATQRFRAGLELLFAA
jgi:hypothetical protein